MTHGRESAQERHGDSSGIDNLRSSVTLRQPLKSRSQGSGNATFARSNQSVYTCQEHGIMLACLDNYAVVCCRHS
eukprot:5165804-Amphidinium_carterae.1